MTGDVNDCQKKGGIENMGRWEPNARGRLEQAALDLYHERGFEQTTVAQIAERAGLTERTFFRHFIDKREVFFWSQSMLQELLANTIASQPAQATPFAMIVAAFDAMADTFPQQRREFLRQRQAVIAANTELQERDLLKQASLTSNIARALHQHGIPYPTATLLAETGSAIMKVAYLRWINQTTPQTLSQLLHESLDQIKTLLCPH
jgi:AcrR family transcriptional regulator